MNTLYVCRANIGRSQIAAALHKQLYPLDFVGSAGTHVEGNHGFDGQSLVEFASSRPAEDASHHVLTVLAELGIDTSQLKRRQLTKPLLEDYGRVVVMADRADWPDYLRHSAKVVKWQVEDGKGRSLEFHRAYTGQIRALVKFWERPRW